MSEQGAGREAGPQFALQRIYICDSSFESPRAPLAFRGQWQPKINLDLNSGHSEIEEGLYEIKLHLTVTARNQEDEIIYLAEVQQAGIFLIRGLEDAVMGQTLGSFCPAVLFPYAREAIDAMVIKGSFPALMLAPVNFDALWEQTKAQREQNNIQ